jgi:hypothetical protein
MLIERGYAHSIAVAQVGDICAAQLAGGVVQQAVVDLRHPCARPAISVSITAWASSSAASPSLAKTYNLLILLA